VDTGKPIAGGSPPALEVRTRGSDRSLPAGRSYQIGRDPLCDIVITDARVSWHHAALRTEDGRWVLVDNGSTNGTYAGGRRVSRIEITGEIVVRLGHPTDGPVLTCTVAATGRGKQGAPSVHLGPGTVEEGATALLPAPRPAPEPAPAPPPSRTLRIGRSPDNDIVVLDHDVSRHHAELRGTAGAYRIVDLASANGTFVNGQRGTDVPLSEGDVVRIGSASFRLAGQELQKITESGAGTRRPPPP
jgi:ABC transport system ATP-binding/permease protein